LQIYSLSLIEWIDLRLGITSTKTSHQIAEARGSRTLSIPRSENTNSSPEDPEGYHPSDIVKRICICLPWSRHLPVARPLKSKTASLHVAQRCHLPHHALRSESFGWQKVSARPTRMPRTSFSVSPPWPPSRPINPITTIAAFGSSGEIPKLA
jgi:hypothetical protein